MNKHKLSRLAILGLPLLLVALSGNSQAAGVSFAKHVKPLLDKHCTECHRSGGEGATKSGFLIESYDSLMKGTKFGAVIVPGDAVSSSLYRLLAGEVDPSIRCHTTRIRCRHRISPLLKSGSIRARRTTEALSDALPLRPVGRAVASMIHRTYP